MERGVQTKRIAQVTLSVLFPAGEPGGWAEKVGWLAGWRAGGLAGWLGISLGGANIGGVQTTEVWGCRGDCFWRA